jgi:hypothetical protein
MSAATPIVPETSQRQRGVRRTAWVLGIVAAVFYFGFIVMMVWRATR